MKDGKLTRAERRALKAIETNETEPSGMTPAQFYCVLAGLVAVSLGSLWAVVRIVEVIAS